MKQKHTFALCSYVKKSKANQESQVPVYLRLTMDRNRLEISTKTLVHPTKWNPKKGRVKGTTKEARRLNFAIESHEHQAREIYNRLLERGKLFTVLDIKNELTAMEHKRRNLLATLQTHVLEMETKESNGCSKGTIKNWKVTQATYRYFYQSISNARIFNLKNWMKAL